MHQVWLIILGSTLPCFNQYIVDPVIFTKFYFSRGEQTREFKNPAKIIFIIAPLKKKSQNQKFVKN